MSRSGQRATDDTAAYPKWRSHSKSIRAALGVTMSCAPWTTKSNFVGEGLNLTPRVLDLLDLTTIKVLEDRNRNLRSGMKHIYVDVSQSVLRDCFTSGDEVSPCFTTSTEMYSFAEDRVILPQEMLSMHGYQSVAVPNSVSPRDLKRMVGGGMSLPCVGTVLAALHVMKCTK